MALTRPTLLSVPAFDATQQQTFTFSVASGSSQITANLLTIRNNDTNDIVYQEKQETFKYEHIVNADELTNGVYYNAVISVFDSNGNESPVSTPIQFWCYSSPILTITNFPSNNVINNSSFAFQFTYTQTQNEPLNSYIFNLYNSSQVQISTSGIQYTDNGSPPFNDQYVFTGFENNTVYFVQLSGVTVEGTVLTGELQQFTVQYEQPDLFTLVQLTNNCDEGYITVTSNIVLIEGESNPSPPTYINGQEVDLTKSDSYVQWNQGFNIVGNMLSRIWFRNPNVYSTIAQFSNINGQIITLKYMQGYENINSTELQSYMELYVRSIQGIEYYIFSNYVPILSSNKQYVVYLNRVNDTYSLQLLTNSN